MKDLEEDITYASDEGYVLRMGKGHFEVRRNNVTHSVVVHTVCYPDDEPYAMAQAKARLDAMAKGPPSSFPLMTIARVHGERYEDVLLVAAYLRACWLGEDTQPSANAAGDAMEIMCSSAIRAINEHAAARWGLR